MKNFTNLKNTCKPVMGCLVCLALFSCSGGQKAGFQEEASVFKFSEGALHSPAVFFEQVTSIKLIPLESKPVLMAGNSSSDMIVDEDDFIIYDGGENSRICRFSRDGKFLNVIGEQGRGPKEYIDLRGVQVLGDTVLAHFCAKETFIHYYDKTGNFIRTDKFDVSSWDMRKMGNDFLLARGYGAVDPVDRVILKSPAGDKMFFGTRIMVASGESSPMFSVYNDVKGKEPAYYLLRETFNDTVYMYSVADQEFKPRAVFEFGEAGVDKSFFEQDNYEASFRILFDSFGKKGFVTGVRYLENDKMRFADFTQNRENARFIEFYEGKGVRETAGDGWYLFSEDGNSGFSGSIKQLYEGQLYALLQPDFCMDLPAYIKSKISNPEILDNLTEESNCVVAILDMKE